jgi:hypothetical protein
VLLPRHCLNSLSVLAADGFRYGFATGIDEFSDNDHDLTSTSTK